MGILRNCGVNCGSFRIMVQYMQLMSDLWLEGTSIKRSHYNAFDQTIVAMQLTWSYASKVRLECQRKVETGSIVSLVRDIPEKGVSTFIAWHCMALLADSVAHRPDHWAHAKRASDDKRNEEDFERFRKLSAMGSLTDSKLLSNHRTVIKHFKTKGIET